MDSPIIKNITDNDLYKFSMQQVVLHQFPGAFVTYNFQDRGNVGLGHLADRVRDQINSLEDLKITNEELNYLRGIPFFSNDYVDFLRIFRFFPKEHIDVKNVEERLSIRISGPWLHTILYEIYVLAIVNQVYCEWYIEENGLNLYDLHKEGESRLYKKLNIIEASQITYDNFSPFIFSNFGTRRRFSREWAERVDEIISNFFRDKVGFAGTSNVYNAMKNDVKPIGTMAHEFQQAMQVYTRPTESIGYSLNCWSREYRGSLGIALSDCLGLKMFLRDFDLYYAKLFDGLRHDSGDPDWWTENVVNHYKKLGIDPLTKTAIYSDGLNVRKSIDIWRKWRSKIKVGFGIGTNLTNDVGIDPLKIVLKMVQCNGDPVAKISDSPGKGMCEDEGYISYLKGRIERFVGGH